jgi:chromosomal replication initiation ATPase DnaA
MLVNQYIKHPIERILDVIVEGESGMTRRMIKSGRASKTVWLRQAAMLICRELRLESAEEIGNDFNMTKGAVRYACRAAMAKMTESDPHLVQYCIYRAKYLKSLMRDNGTPPV